MKTIEGKASVAVVTGSGRGVGKATAMAMARAGWKVALVARSLNELEAVREEVRSDGGEAVCHAGDVSDHRSIREIWGRICAQLGPPDCLVNNAAIVDPVGPVVETDPHDWVRSVEINLIGAFLCTRMALKSMIERKRGSVLNIVSGMGQRVFAGFSAYSVSKAGLIHLTRVLAEEVRPYGVTVNGLDPGLVHTNMQANLREMPAEAVGQEMLERSRWFHEEGLLKPPEVIGNWIAAFLAGKAREITGEVGTLTDYQDRHGIPIPST